MDLSSHIKLFHQDQIKKDDHMEAVLNKIQGGLRAIQTNGDRLGASLADLNVDFQMLQRETHERNDVVEQLVARHAGPDQPRTDDSCSTGLCATEVRLHLGVHGL